MSEEQLDEIGFALRKAPVDYGLATNIEERIPVERVWKTTRLKATQNRCFNSLNDVKIAIENLFQSWRPAKILLNQISRSV